MNLVKYHSEQNDTNIILVAVLVQTLLIFALLRALLITIYLGKEKLLNKKDLCYILTGTMLAD